MIKRNRFLVKAIALMLSVILLISIPMQIFALEAQDESEQSLETISETLVNEVPIEQPQIDTTFEGISNEGFLHGQEYVKVLKKGNSLSIIYDSVEDHHLDCDIYNWFSGNLLYSGDLAWDNSYKLYIVDIDIGLLTEFSSTEKEEKDNRTSDIPLRIVLNDGVNQFEEIVFRDIGFIETIRTEVTEDGDTILFWNPIKNTTGYQIALKNNEELYFFDTSDNYLKIENERLTNDSDLFLTPYSIENEIKYFGETVEYDLTEFNNFSKSENNEFNDESANQEDNENVEESDSTSIDSSGESFLDKDTPVDDSVLKSDNADISEDETVESQENILAEELIGGVEIPDDGNRYTVLLLDNSGSMSGTPLSTEKAAAKKFCNQMLKAEGVNYISIVTYSDYVKKTNDFTNQYNVLENQLDNMTAYGGTNTNAALEQAIVMLNDAPETAIKNIVLLSDGIPESGTAIMQGRYSSNDSSYYEYGNAVYETAKSINTSWNLYSLGFFHGLGGNDLIFARKLMSDLPASKNMYYEVTDVNDLEFMFGEIVDEITQSELKKIYINQHISYINSTQYSKDIIPGFGPLLSQILLDIREDSRVQKYNLCQNLSDLLNYELDLTQEYELLLANLMVNDQSYKGIKDVYLSNLNATISDTLSLVTDSVENHVDTVRATDKKRMVELYNKLMRESFLSDDYRLLHEEYNEIVNEYYSAGDMANLLGKLGPVLDTADVVLSTASETIEYYCFAQAYIDTTDDFIKTLGLLYYCASTNAWASNVEGIKPTKQLFELTELQTAIEIFIDQMEAYKDDNAAALANFALSKLTSEIESKIANIVTDKAVDLLASQIPIFKTIPYLKTGLEAGLTIVDIFTNLDDRAASGNMVEKLYIITAMMDEVVEMLEGGLDYNSSNSEDYLFRRSAQFDEAVNIYKTAMWLAADYGEEYEKTLLTTESAKIMSSKEKISWYSTAITLANVDKLRTNNILCHSEGLIYNHKSDIIFNTDRLKIFTIACPIDVDVLNNQGERIAHLSDKNSYVNDDYTPYFFTLSNSNNEFLKVVVLPESSEFQILLSGTGEGNMDIYLGAYDGAEIYNVKKYSGINVSKKDQGYLSLEEVDGFRKLVFNNAEYTDDDIHGYFPFKSYIINRNGSDKAMITTDSSQYYCAKNQTFTINAKIQTPEILEKGSKKYTGYIAVYQDWSWIQLGAWRIDGGTISVELPVTIKDAPLGKKLFTVSLFNSDNFTTGASLYDCMFYVDILPGSFKLTFDSDGGTCEKTSQDITFGCAYGELPTPKRDGYFFNGWFSERGGKGERVIAQSIVEATSNQTVYASWRELYNDHILVEFNANGGINTITYQHYSDGDKYGEMPIPKKNGSRFIGWYTEKDSGKLIDSNTKVTSQTLYAHWKTLPIYLSECSISIKDTKCVYNGKAQKPTITVKDGSVKLSNGEDYKVEFLDNINAGSATLTLSGIGDYEGKITQSFNIAPAPISNTSVTGVVTKTYTGKELKQSPVVYFGETKLKKNIDYTISYKNNTNVGIAKVIIKGINNYSGTKEESFNINKASPELKFAKKTVVRTTLDSAFINELMKTTDGIVEFSSNNTNVAVVDSKSGLVTINGEGNAMITVKAAVGKNYDSGSAAYELIVSAVDIENSSVEGVSLSYGYSGKAYTPSLTIKVNGATLIENTDYTINYANNKNPGTATITISGKGNYTGRRIKTFEIVDCVSSIVSGHTYQLIPKNNSATAVSSLSGKMVNNTKIYITNRSESEAMKFKAVKNSDGTWKFINGKCELALAVQQNSSAVGAGLVLYDQTTKTAQNWKLSKKSDNSFAIMNAVTGYSIAMSDASAVKGTTLSMAETASSGLQRFYIAETTAVSTPFDGTYGVKASKDKKFALNIASSSKDDGANVNLYSYSNTNAKKFKVMYSGGGYYRLVNVNSGLCLTVKGNTKKDGANVIQSKWAAQSGQRWRIVRNSDGTVTLTNALGTVLHLNGNKTANGTIVLAKKTASTKAQRWYLN